MPPLTTLIPINVCVAILTKTLHTFWSGNLCGSGLHHQRGSGTSPERRVQKESFVHPISAVPCVKQHPSIPIMDLGGRNVQKCPSRSSLPLRPCLSLSLFLKSHMLQSFCTKRSIEKANLFTVSFTSFVGVFENSFLWLNIFVRNASFFSTW